MKLVPGQFILTGLQNFFEFNQLEAVCTIVVDLEISLGEKITLLKRRELENVGSGAIQTNMA